MGFEFNLYITIRQSSGVPHESRATGERSVHQIIMDWLDDSPQGWAPLASDRNVRAEVVFLNGVYALIAFGSKNHNNGMDHMLKELLTFIGEVAPGSFGFAHILDHETPEPGFVVLTLARGEVVERKDQWLSPLVPTVEGPPSAVL